MTDDIIAKFTLPGSFILPEVEANAKPATRKSKHFISALPLEIVIICAAGGCEVALPLILAIHRQLTMTGRDWTPLNKEIWAAAGDPPEKKRTKILSVLKARPDLILIQPKKTATSHYKVAYGTLWSAQG